MDNSAPLVEHFFRHESANLVAVLTRAFGIRRMELVEDMVQVAMVEALRAWRHRGVPDNPNAWIHQVARNRILDALRREKIHEKAVALSGQSLERQQSVVDSWLGQEQISDSLLRMMFVCCHPTLERKTQIALTLKTLCGFGVSEIAKGLLLAPETVKKRITRAKHQLAEQNVPIELPTALQQEQRLGVVHDVLYLMFNEGYSTSHGSTPIRDDICEEAARLCHLLCHSQCCTSTTKALLALQLFHASRLESRLDSDGAVILLEDQDRSQWDQRLIQAAIYWLDQSKTETPSTYHLEAAIAMQHCRAPSIAETNWSLIVRYYQQLLQQRPSPLYLLNQAIAIGQAGDTATALQQLHSLSDSPDLKDYLLLDCAIARIHELSHNPAAAIDAYLKALPKATAPHEKALLEKKLGQVNQIRA